MKKGAFLESVTIFRQCNEQAGTALAVVREAPAFEGDIFGQHVVPYSYDDNSGILSK